MIIDISAGSGGKATKELIEEVFARHFTHPELLRAEDAAAVDMAGGRVAMTTDSYVVDPMFFKGGDIGRLAVCGTVNDLAVKGAVPRYISAAFIIQTGTDTETLGRIAESMAAAADESGVAIVACDTKVVQGGREGGVFINTTGIGDIPPGRDIGPHRIAEGSSIIVSGNLGDHHAAIISSRMNIKNDIASDVAPLNKPISALFEAGVRVQCMRDITRGGLATVLNELAASAGLEALISEADLPVDSRVKGLCDILGLDPVYMGNEGKFVLIMPPEDAGRALSVLHDFKICTTAREIGSTQSGPHDLVMETEFGGMRKLPLLQGEGLPRIC